MKQAVIIEMSTEELVGTLTEVRATLAKLNLAHAVSPLENPVQIRETKKTVARILTEVRRRELEA
ncbi:MAG: 50S ribosomal protein L29 [Flavobacteriales bacterium]|jgi:large subunit ribosomal protein L29|tara:strand:+ start:3189 stop:3383 length:195 start_codon:yes stop_codon:yes gene_type:complete